MSPICICEYLLCVHMRGDYCETLILSELYHLLVLLWYQLEYLPQFRLPSLVKNLVTRFHKQSLSVIVRTTMYPALINQGGCRHCRQPKSDPTKGCEVVLGIMFTRVTAIDQPHILIKTSESREQGAAKGPFSVLLKIPCQGGTLAQG
jgi:hypothetical protein